MVSKLEDFLQSHYKYFFGSPKRHLEFTKLEIVEIEGLKVLWNVKTRWINMLAPFKKFGKDYKTLIAKMVVDNGIVEASKANLVNLCDVGTILGLPCVLPMLESINALMKFVQVNDVFVCDYIAIIKICQTNMYKMYNDSTTSS